MRSLLESAVTPILTAVPASSPVHSSTWHSPVPYLFGGLAAMLGLIAFALLILACSYWRISGFLDSPPGGDDTTTTENNNSSSSSAPGNLKQVGPTRKPTPYLEEGFVVIMAGDEKPTFLATPANSRATVDSFGSEGGKVTGKIEDRDKKEEVMKGAGEGSGEL